MDFKLNFQIGKASCLDHNLAGLGARTVLEDWLLSNQSGDRALRLKILSCAYEGLPNVQHGGYLFPIYLQKKENQYVSFVSYDFIFEI